MTKAIYLISDINKAYIDDEARKAEKTKDQSYLCSSIPKWFMPAF